MKKLKIIIGLMLWINLVSGQYFNNTYDYNNTLDWARTVLSHDNHIYVGSGFSDFQLGGAEGLLFSKIDYSGQVIWSKSLIFADSSLSNGYSGSLQLHGQGFVQVGTTFGIGSPYSVLLIKRDLNGDTIFTRRYQHGAGSIGRSAHVLADQSIILFSESIATANAQANLTIWKLDSLGNVLWVQAYPNGGVDFCVGGTVDEDGNIYISGGNGVYPNEKGLIIKADSMGTYIHKKTYLTNIGMGVTYYDGSLYAKSVQYYSSNSNDLRLILLKINTNLDTIWTKYYTNMPYTASSTAPILINDRMYLAGNREENIKKGILLMSDTLGQIQFQRIYQSSPIGSTHFVTDMTPTADGGFALVGWTSNPGQNAWVVKVDSLGCLVPNCALSEEELPTTNELRLWPNPTTGILNILLPQSSGPAELSLTDITGRVVHHEWTANSTELVLEMNHLPPGMYFLQVRTAAGVLFTDKVVKQ